MGEQPNDSSPKDVRISLTKVTASDVSIPTSLPFESGEEYLLLWNTTSHYKLDDGIIKVVFNVTGSVVKDEQGTDETQVFRLTLTMENTVQTEDGPIPEKSMPHLTKTVFAKLVEEAYATTRGYTLALLRDTPLQNLVLGYVSPDVFLKGDIEKMLTTRELPPEPST